MGEIVVMPGPVVNQLVNMDVSPNEADKVDVLKVLVRSHVSVELAADSTRCTSQIREIVVMPDAVVNQFVDMVVEEDDVLKVIVSGLITNQSVA